MTETCEYGTRGIYLIEGTKLSSYLRADVTHGFSGFVKNRYWLAVKKRFASDWLNRRVTSVTSWWQGYQNTQQQKTNMKLKDIELTDKNHFVGMEYYFLILNRTFLVVKTNDYLIGIQGNGVVSVEGGKDILTRQITSSMAVKGDLINPNSYLKNSYLEKIDDLDLLDGSIIKSNKINFMIKLSDIRNTHYNPNKKFGMGPYPHDGRVTIETCDSKKREFIVLGNQSGQNIANWILTK